MSCTARSACLLAALLLAPPPASAQRSHGHTSQHAAPAAENVSRPSPDLARVVRGILRRTNEFRRQHGRRELKRNADLTRAAQYFADYLARKDKFSHTADGDEPWERTEKFGYDYCIVAENIAYRYSSAGFSSRELARGFMKGWKKSPGHRKNLLDPDVYEIGIGVARSSKNGRYYAAQDFGRPKSKAITFRVTNQTDTSVDYTVDGKAYTVRPRYTITLMRCRPPTAHFRLSGPGQTGNEKVYHPHNGTHYVLRRVEGDRVTVETD
jgi:uncharacterized protein YkwD